MKSSEEFGFDYDGSSVIVYNSSKDHILSEEDDTIDLIIYNRVATLHGKIAFQKVLVQLSDPGLIMIDSYKQRN